MPHKRVFTPQGRYVKVIDWLLVQQLIDEGFSGIEIAKTLKIHPNTLYHRVFKEHGWCLFQWMLKRQLLARGSSYDPYPEIKTLERVL